MSCPAGLRPFWEAEWSTTPIANGRRVVGGERRHNPFSKILCGRVGKGGGLGVPATAVGLDRFRARPHIHFVDEQIIRTPSHARSCPARDLGATLLRSEEESDIWMAFMLFRETRAPGLQSLWILHPSVDWGALAFSEWDMQIKQERVKKSSAVYLFLFLHLLHFPKNRQNQGAEDSWVLMESWLCFSRCAIPFFLAARRYCETVRISATDTRKHSRTTGLYLCASATKTVKSRPKTPGAPSKAGASASGCSCSRGRDPYRRRGLLWRGDDGVTRRECVHLRCKGWR